MKFLVVLVLIASAGSALASDLDFFLINKTARDFGALYVSAADDKDWNGNLFADDFLLEPDAKVDVQFHEARDVAVWDLKFVDNSGVASRFDKVNLINVTTITISESNGEIVITAE